MALPPVQIAHLQQACASWYDSALFPKGFNGGIIVAKNGQIVFEKYNGTTHLPGKESINENTSLHIASVSKTFTAMAVLKLWEEKKLNIDDEFSKYFPEFNYPGVTIRTLLNHRSGLPNYTHFYEKSSWDKTKMLSNQDILQTLIKKDIEFPPAAKPNTRFNYCNTNYALLALLIEKISGQTYGKYLEEVFFHPLQMKNTHVFTMADSGRFPPSYDWKNRLIPLNYLDAIYGDKNIYTTPRDLLIWDRALYSGKLFQASTLEQAFTPYSNERPGIKNYGLGWRMNIYSNSKKMIFHNGWWHGSNAAFIRLVQDTATIIVIGNKFNRGIYHSKNLANIFSNYFAATDNMEESEGMKINDSIPFQNDESETGKIAPLTARDSILNDILIKSNKKTLQ